MQFILDDTHAETFIGQHILQILDQFEELVVFILEFFSLQAGELTQTHLHDSLSLQICESPLLHQSVLGLLYRPGSTNQSNHLIDDVECLEESFQNMGTGLGLLEVELGTADYHLVTVLDVLCNHVFQIKRHRAAVYQRNIVHAECRLQRGHLIQLVEHHLGYHILAQVIHNARAVTLVGQVLNIRNAHNLVILHQLNRVANHIGRIHHVWQRGHDDTVTILVGFYIRMATHHDSAATGIEGLLHALHAVNHAT